MASPTSVPAELQASFGIFRTAHNASDAPGGELATQLANALPGPALDLARKIDGSDGRTYYVVPAANGLVCITSTGGGACGGADTAAHSGLIETDLCVAGQPDQIRLVGLAPDGVDKVQITATDGSSTAAAVNDNLYVALLLRATPPAAVSWQAHGGQQISQRVNLPPDATQSC